MERTVELKSYVKKSNGVNITVVIADETMYQDDVFILKDDIVKDGVDEDGNTKRFLFEDTRSAARILCDIILEENGHIPYWYLIEQEHYKAFEDTAKDFEKAKARDYTLNKNRGRTFEKHISEQRALLEIKELHFDWVKNLVKIKYHSYRLGQEEFSDDPMQKSMLEEDGFVDELTMAEIEANAYNKKSRAAKKNEIIFTVSENNYHDKGVFSPFGPQIIHCFNMMNNEMIRLWKKSIHLKHNIASLINDDGINYS